MFKYFKVDGDARHLPDVPKSCNLGFSDFLIFFLILIVHIPDHKVQQNSGYQSDCVECVHDVLPRFYGGYV